MDVIDETKRKARSVRKRKGSRNAQLEAARAVKAARTFSAEDQDVDTASPHSQVTILGQESGDPRSSNQGLSRSSKKLLPFAKEQSLIDNENVFMLVDFKCLSQAIEEYTVCCNCHGKLCLEKEQKFGLAFKLAISCGNPECQNKSLFYSSKRCDAKDNQEKKQSGPFVVNQRAILSMCMLGRGFEGLNMFCGIMNMESPMKKKTFTKLLSSLRKAANCVADNSMSTAASDVHEKEDEVDGITNSTCVFDGTWQKRGFSSLVGAVSCISTVNYKVLDIEILSKFCRKCEEIKRLRLTREKEEHLVLDHNCTKNHEGSSPAMEVVGVRRIFGRSIEKNHIRITGYVGDGDSKAYHTIAEEKPYGDCFEIKKYECIGHIQKRLGKNLRNLKSKTGKKKLADGKTIGGKGRLTLKEIDKLQVYYGLAIRRNIGNLSGMQTAIDAILRHRLSTDELPNHSSCPTGEDSWCKYHLSPETYKHTNPMPRAVAVHIKPVFDKLKDDQLLSRCLAGFNQNAAESFNNIL